MILSKIGKIAATNKGLTILATQSGATQSKQGHLIGWPHPHLWLPLFMPVHCRFGQNLAWRDFFWRDLFWRHFAWP
jgi:hypothetical protein